MELCIKMYENAELCIYMYVPTMFKPRDGHKFTQDNSAFHEVALASSELWRSPNETKFYMNENFKTTLCVSMCT